MIHLRLLKWLWIGLVIAVLTLLTQIGGIVYLMSFAARPFIARRFPRARTMIVLQGVVFIFLYLAFTLVLVPPLAKLLGREALPLFSSHYVKPGTVLTPLLNRNYVRPSLKTSLYKVAGAMHEAFPGTMINYLDASFPFIDGYPLPPHLSHSDGKKLDISFAYRDRVNGEISNDLPSAIGYGICEGPLPGEANMPEICAKKGFWQYNLLADIVSQSRKDQFLFDAARTRLLVNLFAREASTGKIFIEPHLRSRLQLVSEKVRFHGCQAVRHDDHIHVQLK